jgi:Domain of unknown function (DUF5655)
VRPQELFTDQPLALAVLGKVTSIAEEIGGVEIRASKSQVAFRRKRGFAYLWPPGKYLSNPDAEVVLSIALGRHDRSSRFKEVAHPTQAHWIHHLEVTDLAEIDDEVVDWLREAAERAG